MREEELRIMKRVLAVLACLFVCQGCNPWKTTKTVYKDYINPAPELCLDVNTACSPTELYQASVFGPVDTRLDSLRETLASRDDFPGDKWFETTRQKYPWLGVLTAVDSTGDILVNEVESSGVPVELFLEHGDAWNDRRPRMVVAGDHNGSRVFLGTPFFRGTSFQGVLIAGFDPALVAGFSPQPEKLGIIADGTSAWLGKGVSGHGGVLETDWKQELEKNIRGELTSESGDVVWLGRRYGDKWIVYLISM